MIRKALTAVLAGSLAVVCGAAPGLATDQEELEKARNCMKCGHCDEAFSTLNGLAKHGHPRARGCRRIAELNRSHDVHHQRLD